jgi:hypothetical protein
MKGPAVDRTTLTGFRCSTGPSFELEVENWLRTDAVAWLNDVPRARFQRRQLAFVETEGTVVAVVAWQDIVLIDVDGIWLQVLAVAVDHQHTGIGRLAYDATVIHLQSTERAGDHLAGLVHVDNMRSQRLLATVGWTEVARQGDHAVWVGSL